MPNEQIDKSVVNLMKAIKQHESGGNYSSRGKSGEYGAYQFTEPTFKAYAIQYAKMPNARLDSPEDQDKVTYYAIKGMKDKGYTPEQVLSEWNSGDKDAYKRDHKGINEYGAEYNTPAYVEMVKKIAIGDKMTPKSTTAPVVQPKKETLGQELIGRTQQGTEAIKEGLKGKQNFFSGLLQAGGAVAGAIGDVTTKALSAITPDFIEKPVVGLIQKGATKLAQTETGQKIGGAISKFAEEHPEAAANIGAVTNIVAAIPILKGVGLAKNVALDAASLALKKQAEKIAVRDFTEVAMKTVGGRKTLQKSPNAVQVLIKERAIPDIEDGKYVVDEARRKLGQQITDLDKNVLQPTLDKSISVGGVQTSFFPMQTVKAKALQIAKDELKDTAPIEAYFTRLITKYGQTPNIAQLNKAKRIVSKNITEAGFNSPTYSTDKIVRSALQESVEEGAQALGLADVAKINQQMAELIKAQNLLKYLEGKSVKTGIVGETIKQGATVGGEIIGSGSGIPIAGTLAGRSAGGFVGKKLSGSGMTQGILKRTGKNAERVSRGEMKKKLKGLFGGIAVQKTTNQKKDNRQR